MLQFKPLRPGIPVSQVVGLLPYMLDPECEDRAAEQFDRGYGHGGGWRPFKGFEVLNWDEMLIKYPGDPPYQPLAHAYLRDERIIVYPCSWVMVLQPTSTYEMCRMD